MARFSPGAPWRLERGARSQDSGARAAEPGQRSQDQGSGARTRAAEPGPGQRSQDSGARAAASDIEGERHRRRATSKASDIEGSIRLNQAQSGSIRLNQAQSPKIDRPGCFQTHEEHLTWVAVPDKTTGAGGRHGAWAKRHGPRCEFHAPRGRRPPE